jgi:hypothetical protein
MEIKRKFVDISSNDDQYPKTLIIRNTEGGLIWQVYHVNNIQEAAILAHNADGNGFLDITLEDHKPEMEQTWEDWRETTGGQNIVEKSLSGFFSII